MGVHLRGKFFAAADLFDIAHPGILDPHYLSGCTLEILPSTDLHVPLGGVLLVMQQELRRAVQNGCHWHDLRVAIRNIVARTAPKSGLVFVLKKAGVLIGSLLLGATGALILGIVGVFAGSWLGSKITRWLLELSYVVARTDLQLHDKHMQLVIPEYCENALRDITTAAAAQFARCKTELRHNRVRHYRKLLWLRRTEDTVIDTFLEQFSLTLDQLQARHQRNLIRLWPLIDLSLIERWLQSSRARGRVEWLSRAFSEAEKRLIAGRECLEQQNRWNKLARIVAWLGHVSLNSTRMRRLTEAFTASVMTIEALRVATLADYAASEQSVLNLHAETVQKACDHFSYEMLKKIKQQTDLADQKIAILYARAKEIGYDVHVNVAWKSAA